MTSSGWIISHRCSWITVYVLCCNDQVNLIVILMTFVCLLYSINCPTVICLPSMLFILWRDTTSELWTPVHSFTLLLPFTITCFIYILVNYYLLPLDTLNTLFISNRWDWQPHCKLGKVLGCVVCRFYVAAGAKLCPGRGVITHKYRGSCVGFSISKSIAPNEELKVG
jgi:hypothetical protein